MLQGFANWKFRLTDDLTLVTGAHYLQLTLNNNYSIEPRAGMKWKFAPRHSLSAGFGIHSQRDNLSTYLFKYTDNQGVETQPNINLDFAKAQHYVLGYDFVISENLFLKAETYYQDLYDVGVDRNNENHESMLNLSNYYADIPLKNAGTGKNYGLELTLEKYFSDNYYFLLTGSLFESKYKGSDGIERDTRYNSKYAMNFLAGKEFVFGSEKKKKTFGISVRTTYVGGQRITPIDLDASILAGTTIRDHSRAWEDKVDDYFRLDLQLNLRSNREKTTHILKLGYSEYHQSIEHFPHLLRFGNSNHQEEYTARLDSCAQLQGEVLIFGAETLAQFVQHSYQFCSYSYSQQARTNSVWTSTARQLFAKKRTTKQLDLKRGCPKRRQPCFFLRRLSIGMLPDNLRV